MHTLNAVKLRNQIHENDPMLEVTLKNVRINGVLQGCSGFVRDPKTGAILYVNTDRNHGLNSRTLYRTAESLTDYTGGRNQYADYDETALVIARHFWAIREARGLDH